ncbi:hypothetical protein CDLVIII_0743 [Clostridium sp. DL-VIII]|uniref:hypothetical protein n=1 Tax=Clostridium sp. DL-VIII TaxID=641107 RepID=UPI00023AF82E|nr:hypothetical protein [Clostridium sp. DL-VIII]EHI97468.1 hypothetical protein CDLVIII_0743 [Clostridium sp. DL-VIII]
MKKVCVYLLSIFIILLNIYLMFFWQPEGQIAASDTISKEIVSYNNGTVFKVDKEKALEQLSSEDRKDFEKILKKLSALDMGKIREYYEEDNEEEGITNAFKLLNKRLSDEDYKEIERISSNFIQLDKVNEKIKNK